jgi:His-Xaa-Ser system radical SAM maturase HxsB
MPGPSTKFLPREAFALKAETYCLLPFRFSRLPKPSGTVLVTSDTGEYAFLSDDELQDYVSKRLSSSTALYLDLRAKHFLIEPDVEPHFELMTAQIRTRKSFLFQGPSLHIFVMTLRCDHSCLYCQVSRQSTDASRFDMTEESIAHAVDRVFESPATGLTIEFQGGEPTLNFDGIKRVVELVEERNAEEERHITFTITSTLHLLTDEMLEYCRDHKIGLSTSLDGPDFIHNANRPNRNKDSYEKTIASIRRAREAIGVENVSALTTLTKNSLKYPKEIINCYVENEFRSIFLRPLSPYGFALKTQSVIGYEMNEFLEFYKVALEYLVELNLAGTPIDEAYTGILLTHILTPFPTGYMDLRSPTGAGLGVLVYNYDGKVYASDEGRMLAETADYRFALGDVSLPYQELINSEAMRWVLASGIAESLPGCSDCAFQPYCGADPVFHAGKQGDPFGHRPTSDFCRKHTGLFEVLFGYLAEKNPEVMRVFLAWFTRRSTAEVPVAGFMG